MRRKFAGLTLVVVACVAVVSADRPGAVEAKRAPVVAAVQGYVSDIEASTTSGRAVCSATVSDGKLGAGEQTYVLATDPLLQAALISAAERQVLVAVQYHPEPGPDERARGRVIQVRLLDQPGHQRQRALDLNPPTATRVIDGRKTTFPARSTAKGGMAALALLESCSSRDWPGGKPPTVEDVEKAKKGDRVHFAFGSPVMVSLFNDTIAVDELVYSEEAGLLVRSGEKVYYGTKFTHNKLDQFRAWYRQTLPVD